MKQLCPNITSTSKARLLNLYKNQSAEASCLLYRQWARCQSSHLTLGKTANEHISQNAELLLIKLAAKSSKFKVYKFSNFE